MNLERCAMVSSGVRVLASALLATFLLAGWATGASAATVTWTGATNTLWSTPGNWVGGVPAAGDRVVFPVTASNRTNTNDLAAGTVFFDITFLGGSYTINGNLIGLSDGVTVDYTANGTNRINNDLQLTASQTVTDLPGYGLTLAGNVAIGANTITLGRYVTVTGVISGTGAVTMGDSTRLTANNTYSGLTTVDPSRRAQIDGNQPGSNVQVGSNGRLSGTGTVGSVTTTTSSLMMPGANFGSNPGKLTTGNLSLGNSSYYLVDLNGSLPSTNYDQLAVNGTVTIGTSVNLSITLNYSPSLGQTFVLIDNDGVDAVVGTFNGLPEGATITLSATDFQISYVGGTGNDVVLTVTAAAKTWTGAVSNLWSVSGNWQGGVPVAGDPLVFPVTASNKINTNDLPAGTVYKQILFTGGSYTINGNLIGLSDGVTVDYTANGTNRINNDLQLTASQTVTDLPGYGLTLAGNVAIGANTITLGRYVTVTGVISGTGAVTMGDSTRLTANNTYSGLTTVDPSRRAQIDGNQPGSNVQVGSNGRLSGTGTVGSVTTTTSSLMMPGANFGNNPGKLTTGNLSLGNSSYYLVDLNGSLPSTNYDQLAVNGTVTIGTSVNLSITLNYSPSLGQTFVLIDNDGVDAVVGTFNGLPEGATITLSATDFQISYVGGTGNDVVLTVTAAAKTWTGAVSNLWSVSGNWQGGVPVAGDPLVFPVTASNKINTNDLPAGTVYKQILFTGGSYTINGNLIGLSDGVTVDYTANGTNRINNDLQLTASQTVTDLPGYGLTLAGNVAIGANTITLGRYVTVTGVISGTGAVTMGDSTRLTANNTYSGLTTVDPSRRAQIDGNQPGSNVQVGSNGRLSGTGTVGSVTTTTSSLMMPGANFGSNPGKLSTGNLSLGNSSYYLVDLNGSLPGTNYDQLAVNGTVTIGTSVNLLNTLNYTPSNGQVFVILDNDGADAVSGTFNGLPEGMTVNLGPYPFKISYIGSTGNDITLTSLSGDPLNAAPVAVDDNYLTQRNTALSVSAPGVLVNDSDPDLNTITVVQAPTTTVQGGTVTVNADGSFLYQPPMGFVGLDSFGYVISDGHNATANATVRITVIRDPIVTASAGAGGSISPSGAVSVPYGTNQTFTIAPSDLCHSIADVLVDSVSVGAVGSYTFSNVQADHTIAASFTLLTCSASDQCHAVGACNPTNGQCSNPASPDGTACSDGNGCTQTDTCQSGTCTGANPVVCAAFDQCHAMGTCAPATGVCGPGYDGFAQAPGSPLPANGGTVWLTAGDLNHDGHLDIAGANQVFGVRVWLGNGAGGFAAAPGSPVTAGNSPYSIVSGDWNGDGTLDLAVANINSSDVTILLGNGLGGFTQPPGSPVAVGVFPYQIVAGDLNNDGSLDLAVTKSQFPHGVTILLGNGLGGFSQPAGSPIPVGGFTPTSIAIADFNGDHNLDLGVTNQSTNSISIHLGDGAGGFTQAGPSITLPAGSFPGFVAAARLDGDAYLDLAVANYGGNSVSILLGNGSGGFSQTGSPIGVGLKPDSLAVADLNGDGIADIAVSNYDADNVSILIGDGSGGFSQSGSPPVATGGDSPVSVVVGDWNQDGRLDLAATNGVGNSSVSILLNRGSAAADGAGCSDGSACTQADTCQSGTCMGGNPVVCTASDQCHTAGTCNPADGQCSNTASPNGTACSDGSACTQTDTCQLGACTGASPVVCNASDQCHDVGICNPANGQCSNPASPNGTACSDGSACTQTDTCQLGTCTGAIPVVCTASDQCHEAGTCNPTTGVCSNPDATNGTSCTDGNACTTSDACSAGACAGGPPPVCDDANVCTDDSCNPATGCVTTNNTAGCDDGDACTTSDSCAAGLCVGAPLPGDTDLDGVCNGVDNCPGDPNPDQENRDFDAQGDACDACPDDPADDSDSDGVCGDHDNCEAVANPPSDCDANPGTPDEQCDADSDGRGDGCDNCPSVANPGQFDDDRDGIGNACETDTDGDGTPDALDPDDDGDGVPDDDGDGTSDPCPDRVRIGCDDNCPTERNPSQRDRDADGQGDACDLDDGTVNGGRGRRGGVVAPLTAGPGSGPDRYEWVPEAGALAYNVYQVPLSQIGPASYGSCYRSGILTTYTVIDEDPPSGDGYGYLVTAVMVSGEGSLGDTSAGEVRANTSACP